MRKFWIILAVVTIAALVGCASTQQQTFWEIERPALEPIEPAPEGTARLILGNGGLAAFRFDLPAGQTWGNYNKLTVDFLLDDANLGKSLRSSAVRLLGNYAESEFAEDNGTMTVSLGQDVNFAQRIIDNHITTWAQLGITANEWYTYEYNITGSRAHGSFNRDNIPAADATGPFFFGLGLSAQDAGPINSINQLVKNVTLHHATNPSLNVVSTGSGFENEASTAYYPADARSSLNY